MTKGPQKGGRGARERAEEGVINSEAAMGRSRCGTHRFMMRRGTECHVWLGMFFDARDADPNHCPTQR